MSAYPFEPRARVPIYEGERVDDLQNDGMLIIQRADAFRFGTDCVLLADFVSVKPNQRLADLGTGTGVLALLICAKAPSLSVDACEIQPVLADMARRSVIMNALDGRVRVENIDMRTAPKAYGAGVFDHVVCNPPYFRAGASTASDTQAMSVARQEGALTLADVCNSASALLKNGGRFWVVFPSQRLFELFTRMQSAHLAPKRVRNVLNNMFSPPRITLVEAVKGGGEQLHWMAPLVLRNADGTPSPEYERIYRQR